MTKKIELGDYFKKDGSVSMSGNLDANGNKVINLKTPSSDTDGATKKYVDDGLNEFVKKDGSVSMTGDLKMGQNRIKELPKLPQTDDVAISKDSLNTQLNTSSHVHLDRYGTLPILKDLNMGSNKITNVSIDNLSGTDATNKNYVDNLIHHSQVKPSHQNDVFSYLMPSVIFTLTIAK